MAGILSEYVELKKSRKLGCLVVIPNWISFFVVLYESKCWWLIYIYTYFWQYVLLPLAISMIRVDIIPHTKNSLFKIISSADFWLKGSLNKRKVELNFLLHPGYFNEQCRVKWPWNVKLIILGSMCLCSRTAWCYQC